MFISLAEHLKPVRALNKPHKGVVVDNNDPLKLNRVKVRIDGLLEAPTADLPWVNTKSNPRFTNIPEIGMNYLLSFLFRTFIFHFMMGIGTMTLTRFQTLILTILIPMVLWILLEISIS
jgi:hypothetical protein